MLRITLLFALMLSQISSSIGQGGTITYNQKYYWLNIVSKMSFISKEEKDRMQLIWGNETDNKGQDYILTWNDDGNIYQEVESKDNIGFSWRSEEDILIRNSKTKKTKDIRFLLGNKYLIEDDLPKYKWKILNELRDIAGYVCMKAETIDTITKAPIHAWFTDKIPARLGPEGFLGLPGMILAMEFNTDDVTIEATKIEIIKDKPVVLPLPKKIKGKMISYQEYYNRKRKHYKLSIQGKRNPFWDLRY
jgi:GLPGLI family protein